MKANVVKKNGKLQIEVAGNLLAPAAYMTYLDENGEFESFRRAGYKLFCVCVNMGDCSINPNSDVLPFSPSVWKARGKYDFTPLHRALKKVVGDGNSPVYVLLRVNISAPLWWQEENPDECIVYGDGLQGMQSVFSQRWKGDAKLFIDQLSAYLKEGAFASNVIGLQIAAMHTEEWIAPRTPTGAYDYSLPARKAFAEYLEKKYGILDGVIPTQEALDARLPQPHSTGVNLTEEYLRFYCEGYAKAICEFAAHAKRACGGDWLVGAFYGYLGQLCADQGHCAFKTVLECPNIDFFASPFAYNNARQGAFDWFYHGAMETCFAAGKLWFLEADVRTWKTQPLYETNPELMDGGKTVCYFKNPVFFGPETERESLWVLLRSFAKVLISGNAFWWFDMWGGWYGSPAMMELLSRMRALYERAFLDDDKEYSAELAVVLNEEASYFTPAKAFRTLSYQQLSWLGFVGTPYALYLAQDGASLAQFGGKATLKILCEKGKNTLLYGDASLEKDTAFTPEELAEQLRAAGVHIYSEGNIVYANARFVALTATSDGRQTLTMPSECKLQAFTDGKIYKGKEFTFEMSINQTELFEVLE